MIKILSAKFIKSASKISEAPDLKFDEVAILGRSNVGKSFTINRITERKNLAKSSNTPGKTQLINFFDIQMLLDDIKKEFVLVDLPGIGYAKVSKSQKKDWEKNLLDFIVHRDNIKLFLYLVDARHPNLEIDRSTIDYLLSLNKEIIFVYTKIDKLKKNELMKLKNRIKENSCLISNLNKNGIQELQTKIFNFIGGKTC
jgi:GTP-binding protein